MIILDGKHVSNLIKKTLIQEINEIKGYGITMKLVVLLVGNSNESLLYVDMKRKMCEKLGILFQLININEDCPESFLINEIEKLNEDSTIHGILIQLPLPKNFNQDKILDVIDYKKDVDGFHTVNAGKIFQNRDINIIPCTPQGCIDLIDHYKIDVKGLNITIIGTSNLVGLPLSMILLQRGATITLCNIHTKDVKKHTQEADLIISCCGVPKMIKNDWIKENCIIIDIGINYIYEKGKKVLVGDVDYEDVKDKCNMITPVPGGIGPMTVISLIKNLLILTKQKHMI